jgi:hypothetical protein
VIFGAGDGSRRPLRDPRGFKGGFGVESAKTSQPAGIAPQPQRKLSAKEILADIREGMSDQALEQKYRLTPDGREKVFKTLLAKGLMGEAELQWRSKLLKSQEASNIVPTHQSPTIPTPVDPPRESDDKPPVPTENPLTSESESSSVSSKLSDESWIENKRILILLLIFASPLGLYGIWKTSRFQKATKAILAVVTVLLALAFYWIAIPVWLVAGTVILGYGLWGRISGAKQRVTQVAGTALQTMPKAQEALKGAKERIAQV